MPVEEGDDVLFILGEEDDFLAAGCERLAVELHGAAIRELGAEKLCCGALGSGGGDGDTDLGLESKATMLNH